MFRHSQRYPLRANHTFFQRAHRVLNPAFTVFSAPIEGLSQAAVIVPKKSFPTAVARNKNKRRVAAVLSPLLASLHQKAIVVVVHQPMTKEILSELREVVKNVS